MSFANLSRMEAGQAKPLMQQKQQTSRTQPTDNDRLHDQSSDYRDVSPDELDGSINLSRDARTQFVALTNSISRALQSLSAEMTSTQRLLNQLGSRQGTSNASIASENESDAVQHEIASALEKCRSLVRDASHDIHELSLIDPKHAGDEPARFTQRKLSRDFQEAITRFQTIQRLAADRQREALSAARTRVQESEPSSLQYQARTGSPQVTNAFDDSRSTSEDAVQEHMLKQRQMLAENEVALNESLISERESEIRDIEAGINELNEIFRDLGSIVNEQGTYIDNIESNISKTVVHVRGANKQLARADNYQRRTRRRTCYLTLLLIVFFFIVLLIVIAS